MKEKHTTLLVAQNEEVARRQASYTEIETFQERFKKSLATSNAELIPQDIRSSQLLRVNAQDIELSKKLDTYINSVDIGWSFPVRYNKLEDLFRCTHKILSEHQTALWSSTLLDVYTFDIHSITILNGTRDAGGNIISYAGTSWPACVENTYLTAMRALPQIAGIESELSLLTSPNAQGFALPKEFNYGMFSSWYFIQGNELLLIGLGYAFGGSRDDPRYADKKFRWEDCSSAVAKWLKADEPFSTKHMIMWHKGDPACQADKFCKAASDVLQPIPQPQGADVAGTIFAFTGHTGVISNYYVIENGPVIIETLSYSRNRPDVEGLGYKNYSKVKDHVYANIDTGSPDKEFFFFIEKIGEHPGQKDEL